MSQVNIGVWGLGTYLPPIVRTNDWWPAEIVDEWRQRQQKRVTRRAADAADDGTTPATRRLLEAAAEYADDPFEGAVERRVMPDDMWPTEMQMAAAYQAIERAGVDLADIDFLLVENVTPDYGVPDGCKLQLEMGLRRDRLFTLHSNCHCNGFVQQLALAEGLIRGGGFRLGLIVQCSVMSRHIRPEDPFSPWFGDAATAAVVGAVPAGKGLLAHAHGTDGRVHNGLVYGVPGKRWYDDGGKIVLYIEDRDKTKDMLLSMADEVEVLLGRALAQSGIRKEEVDFLAAHQGTVWLGRGIQRHVGLEHATRIDTFPWAASVLACNLPLVMATGEKEKKLQDGDVVVGFAGAIGQTVSGMVYRWGR
jgi:3-oxoacyl-[acyl-carrier-protein] synthase III